jgi:SnoaL-like domain
MKRIGFLCLFCFWNTIAFGQGEVPRPDVASQTHCAIPDDDKAIRAIADEWKNQYDRGSASEVASLYTDDAYYLTQHFVTGIVHPRDQIRAYVERGVPVTGSIPSRSSPPIAQATSGMRLRATNRRMAPRRP